MVARQRPAAENGERALALQDPFVVFVVFLVFVTNLVDQAPRAWAARWAAT